MSHIIHKIPKLRRYVWFESQYYDIEELTKPKHKLDDCKLDKYINLNECKPDKNINLNINVDEILADLKISDEALDLEKLFES